MDVMDIDDPLDGRRTGAENPAPSYDVPRWLLLLALLLEYSSTSFSGGCRVASMPLLTPTSLEEDLEVPEEWEFAVIRDESLLTGGLILPLATAPLTAAVLL